MYKQIALITSIAVLATMPQMSALAAVDQPSVAELVSEGHFVTEAGHTVDLYVSNGDDGLLAEATITDPATGESADVWSDGETVWWHGILGGSPIEGSALASDFDAGPQAFCAGPLAIVCIAALVAILAAGTCKTTEEGCGGGRETEVPGGAGGVPPGDGGDGDGDGGKGSGGDEN